MTRREWVMLAGLLALLAMNLWQGRTTERALDRISVQLDAKEQARMDLMDARLLRVESRTNELSAIHKYKLIPEGEQ